VGGLRDEMNNPNYGWWQNFNPPERYDPNTSSSNDDWKYSFAVWGLVAAVIAIVIWVVTAIL
jgi:hypothetical protein